MFTFVCSFKNINPEKKPSSNEATFSFSIEFDYSHNFQAWSFTIFLCIYYWSLVVIEEEKTTFSPWHSFQLLLIGK